jgi:hypothetical protein|nr:MAG TPA: hypothetical protein [Caudoviricetes sp.]
MSRDDVVELVKSLCTEKQLTFVDDILVGNSVLVLISGNDCARVFDCFLTEQGLEHTTPTMIVDGIGSYITIS